MLKNVSVEEKLRFIKVPVLYVYSKKNCFVHLKHADIIAKSLGTKSEIEKFDKKGRKNEITEFLKSGEKWHLKFIEGSHDIFYVSLRL